jgi:hypothetical protein
MSACMRTIYVPNASKRRAKSLSPEQAYIIDIVRWMSFRKKSVLPQTLAKGARATYFMCTAR